MRIVSVIVLMAAPCTLSLVRAQSGDAYAPLDNATANTNLKGSVGFTDGKNGLVIISELRGLLPNKTYDLYLLPAGCPAKAPLSEEGRKKLQAAAKAATKLGTIDSGAGAPAPVRGLTVKAAISRGLLLSRASEPIECADIARSSFGPPPK